jgi:hypothetical protein
MRLHPLNGPLLIPNCQGGKGLSRAVSHMKLVVISHVLEESNESRVYERLYSSVNRGL